MEPAVPGSPEHIQMELHAIILFLVIRTLEWLNPARFINRGLILRFSPDLIFEKLFIAKAAG